MSTRPLVSVVIPVRNAEATIGDCLSALAGQHNAPAFEVLVVDNGSEDASASIAAAHPVTTRVLQEREIGSYAARNRGLRAAVGDILAFTDADCAPHADWLASGSTAMETADAVGGAIRGVVSENPTLWERFDQAMYLDQRAMIEGLNVAATANLFVHRRVIDAVGPFDGDLRSSGDAEFTRRAVTHGMRLRYCDDARVDHRCRTSLVETWRLHRRLGRGWAVLHRRGQWPSPFSDPAMWMRPKRVRRALADYGDPPSKPKVWMLTAVVITARWFGRILPRG